MSKMQVFDPAMRCTTGTGKDLNQSDQALLAEDLRSPCTEEIAVFRAFARTLDQGNNEFVVIDTVPSGHTLLLLDAANAYHRDVERNLNHIPETVKRLLPQLRDPESTKVLFVTLAEATPVHEAAQLQQDLAQPQIRPFAWIIGQSFLATAPRTQLLLNGHRSGRGTSKRFRNNLRTGSRWFPGKQTPLTMKAYTLN